MLPYYYSLNEYIKNTFGQKLYKLALSGGMTCPNRDGTIDSRGCIFCSRGGSGDFTGEAILKKNGSDLTDSVDSNMNQYTNQYHEAILSNLDNQIEAAKQHIQSKYHGGQYIAYFQSFTNTYADINYLRRLYTNVINRPDISVLSIATRPDCLGPEVLSLLDELNQIKPVWVELGLQTIHADSASYIRRGYPLKIYDRAIADLKSIGITTIVHMILGLPGETTDMMLETARYIGNSGADGIKLQLLHILKHTDLADDYANGMFQAMEMDSYLEVLGDILENLPKEMVIHRLTGDGPKNLLIAPLWSSNKKNVMNTMNQYFRDNNIMQGRKF